MVSQKQENSEFQERSGNDIEYCQEVKKSGDRICAQILSSKEDISVLGRETFRCIMGRNQVLVG